MTSVYMRRAHEEDIKSIVSIINNARYYLKEQGLSQWQSGYPNQDTIEEDLVLQRGFVLVVDHQVAGYTAILAGEDPIYTLIEDGQWLMMKQITLAFIALLSLISTGGKNWRSDS